MNQTKINNKLVIKLDGSEISDEFIKLLENDEIKIVNEKELIRTEHPHCAFFKSAHPIGDKVLQRTVLYTPEGRLYQDFDKDDEGSLFQINQYIKKDKHFDLFLLYLRDVEILPSNIVVNEKYDAILMPKSPLNELKDWTEKDLFDTSIKEYEIIIVHILSQLSKIYNKKIAILNRSIHNKVNHLIFEIDEDIEIDEQLFDKWHTHYLRKSRLFKQS